MYIEKIMIKNFRNLQQVYLELNTNLNILLGKNGQGKTNFLEAIYLLGTAESHRTRRDSELINWNSERTIVQLKLQKCEQNVKISITLQGRNKRIEINDNPVQRVSDLLGNLNIVLFSPEDLQLVKGGPAKRRKFINTEVSQVSNYYHRLLKKYNHVLTQRNNLLKELRSNGGKEEMLAIWDKQLVETGSKIINRRLKVLNKIKILARLKQRQITGGQENLTMIYDSSLRGETKKEDTELIFKQNLVNNRNREIERGYTLFGPHRDDIILKINDIDLRRYGSQGQQRTAALALKLAELEFMKSETGEYPVLLLDDVFSELDEKRKKSLIDIIENNIQTFITSTELNSLKKLNMEKGNIYRVNRGNITGGVK